MIHNYSLQLTYDDSSFRKPKCGNRLRIIQSM